MKPYNPFVFVEGLSVMAESEDPIFHELMPQDVRDYWEHEAHNFTPWLANSIRDEDRRHTQPLSREQLSSNPVCDSC
jgi:hypothetical protein